MGNRRTQNHNDRGVRRNSEVSIYRSEQGERCDGNGESNQMRNFICGKNKNRDDAGVNRAAKRAGKYSIVAFKEPPTLVCVTTTAVNTAHKPLRGIFNDFPRTKLNKAATVTRRLGRSFRLRSRIRMRIYVQTLVMIFMPLTSLQPTTSHAGSRPCLPFEYNCKAVLLSRIRFHSQSAPANAGTKQIGWARF